MLHHQQEDQKRLAIWVLESDLIKENGGIHLLSVPGSTSVNLAAQQGVFTFHQLGYEYGRDKLFEQSKMEEMVHNQYCDENAIHKITLGIDYAYDLLNRCQKYGISAAAMFPTIEGAAKAALEWKMAHKSSGAL